MMMNIWITRDDSDEAGYRFTNQHRPVLRVGRWTEANAGGYQTFMYVHDYETLYPAELHLNPGGILRIKNIKTQSLKQEPWDRPRK